MDPQLDISICTVANPCTVEGKITQVSLSGRGPNSGQIVITIQPTGSTIGKNLLCGILGDTRSEHGKEDGVFAGILTMAVLAYHHHLTVAMSYITLVTEVDGVSASEDHAYSVTFRA